MISAMLATISIFALLFAGLTYAAVRNEISAVRVNPWNERG